MMLELVERMKQFVVKSFESFDYYLSSNQQAEIEKLIYGVLFKKIVVLWSRSYNELNVCSFLFFFPSLEWKPKCSQTALLCYPLVGGAQHCWWPSRFTFQLQMIH